MIFSHIYLLASLQKATLIRSDGFLDIPCTLAHGDWLNEHAWNWPYCVFTTHFIVRVIFYSHLRVCIFKFSQSNCQFHFHNDSETAVTSIHLTPFLPLSYLSAICNQNNLSKGNFTKLQKKNPKILGIGSSPYLDHLNLSAKSQRISYYIFYFPDWVS